MTNLMNGCWRSNFVVSPSNWNTKRASIQKKWRITYRYYDPALKGTPDYGRLFAMKGMNSAKTLEERQVLTRALIEQESDLLDVKGWHPIRCQFMTDYHKPASENLSLAAALDYAVKQIKVAPKVMIDILSVVRGVKDSAACLYETTLHYRYDKIPVALIRHRHLRDILKNCYQTNPRFTDKRYNRYKDYLSILFKELLQDDIVESNPASLIQKLPVVKRITQVLTPEEEQTIYSYIREKDYYFWRFMMIFFYSDTRFTELMLMRNDDKIDIANQLFYVTILKGKNRKEVPKQISNEVLHLWQEVLNEAAHGQYLFSVNLRPGQTSIRPDQPTRRWSRWVKRDLGINKDFRSLNHLHLTKVSEAVGITAAATSRGHTTPIITMTRYDVGHKKRLLDEVKNAGVKFGGQ